ILFMTAVSAAHMGLSSCMMSATISYRCRSANMHANDHAKARHPVQDDREQAMARRPRSDMECCGDLRFRRDRDSDQPTSPRSGPERGIAGHHDPSPAAVATAEVDSELRKHSKQRAQEVRVR